MVIMQVRACVVTHPYPIFILCLVIEGKGLMSRNHLASVIPT